MPHQHNRSRNFVEDVLLDQVRVLDGALGVGRRRRIAKSGQIEQVHAVRVLEERGDATQALAAAAPPVQEQDVARRGVAAYLIDEGRSVVFEAFDVGCSARQGEVVSLTCGLCALSKLSQR